MYCCKQRLYGSGSSYPGAGKELDPARNYIKAEDLMNMYSGGNALMDPRHGMSGGFYRKVGPDTNAGYTQGNSGSGNLGFTEKYLDGIARARQLYSWRE